MQYSIAHSPFLARPDTGFQDQIRGPKPRGSRDNDRYDDRSVTIEVIQVTMVTKVISEVLLADTDNE